MTASTRHQLAAIQEPSTKRLLNRPTKNSATMTASTASQGKKKHARRYTLGGKRLR